MQEYSDASAMRNAKSGDRKSRAGIMTPNAESFLCERAGEPGSWG